MRWANVVAMADITPKLRHAQDLLDRGQFAAARESLQQLVRIAPKDRNVNVLMRHALTRLGQHPQALYFAEQALAGAPTDPDLIALTAISMSECGKADRAIQMLDKCLTANPKHMTTRIALARLLGGHQRFVECLKVSVDGLKESPNHPVLGSIYASGMIQMGHADEGLMFMRRNVIASVDKATGQVVARSAAENPDVMATVCGGMRYLSSDDPVDACAAHAAYGRLLERILPVDANPPGGWPQTFEPERKLRIGIFSPDLRDHAVHMFLAPIVEHLDREKFDLRFYSAGARQDAVTEWYRGQAGSPGNFHFVGALSAMGIRELIMRDRVDVLLDLAGFTPGGNLPMFHLRPAPVQISYMGYLSTTGVKAMDYRIVDGVTDPEGSEKHHTEKLLKLDPCFICYRPREDAPSVAPIPPSARSGPGGGFAVKTITFGSFNAMMKLNTPMIKLWARVLKQVDNSKLVLKHTTFAAEDARIHLAQRFKDAGVDPARVIIEPPVQKTSDLLAEYNRIDVALDTFPFPGVTTTCDALWMGVPVVGLQGKSSWSRAGTSLLNTVGLRECIATTDDQYVTIAAHMAADVQRRTELRAGLREQMRASPLCDEPPFVRRFENLVRLAWRERCAKQPAPAAL